MLDRPALLAARASLSASTRRHAEQAIFDTICETLPPAPCHIASYYAVESEVSTNTLHERLWSLGHQLYLPVCHTFRSGYLLYLPYPKNAALKVDKFGIKIPDRPLNQALAPWECDIVLAPCVGFTISKHRIGRGGGFYDRSFAFKKAHTHPLLWGLAFSCQQTSAPPEPWDIPCDHIFTECIRY